MVFVKVVEVKITQFVVTDLAEIWPLRDADVLESCGYGLAACGESQFFLCL
jgi:hypothetical protein